MVTTTMAKPAVEISNDIRSYLREYGQRFPRPDSGFSEALQEREAKLIDELTSFWFDVQKESRNPQNE